MRVDDVFKLVDFNRLSIRAKAARRRYGINGEISANRRHSDQRGKQQLLSDRFAPPGRIFITDRFAVCGIISVNAGGVRGLTTTSDANSQQLVEKQWEKTSRHGKLAN